MSNWMQITFELPNDKYAPFPSLEVGDPKDPINQLGAAIIMCGNTIKFNLDFIFF
jgi:hypothetical protein